jgi:hypothetical protein
VLPRRLRQGVESGSCNGSHGRRRWSGGPAAPGHEERDGNREQAGSHGRERGTSHGGPSLGGHSGPAREGRPAPDKLRTGFRAHRSMCDHAG